MRTLGQQLNGASLLFDWLFHCPSIRGRHVCLHTQLAITPPPSLTWQWSPNNKQTVIYGQITFTDLCYFRVRNFLYCHLLCSINCLRYNAGGPVLNEFIVWLIFRKYIPRLKSQCYRRFIVKKQQLRMKKKSYNTGLPKIKLQAFLSPIGYKN